MTAIITIGGQVFLLGEHCKFKNPSNTRRNVCMFQLKMHKIKYVVDIEFAASFLVFLTGRSSISALLMSW